MKKTTMKALVDYLNGNTVTNIDEIRAELEAELAKGAEKANANRKLYDDAREVVLSCMTSVPTTVAQLYESCKDALPEGFTKSKLQYALTNYWAEYVVKIENPKNANEYRKA